jgi:hypothetical protein
MTSSKEILAALNRCIDDFKPPKKQYLIYPLGAGDEPAIVEAKRNPFYRCQEDTTGTITSCLLMDDPEEEGRMPVSFPPYPLC